MIRLALLASAALAGAPLAAQDHSGHRAPPTEMDHCAMGHVPPEQCPPTVEKRDEQATDHAQHGGMDGTKQASPMEGMDHSAHGAPAEKSAPTAAPETAIPPRAFEGPRHAADAIWGAEAMEPARATLARENGGFRTGMMMIERLEARIPADGGEDGFLWDVQGFFGGDINRFVIKTEGEGEIGGSVGNAEVQALYSRAIGPFFDLQAGIRVDDAPDTRAHFVAGLQGLAPYMFEIDAAIFLSTAGDLTARIEAEYDQRITQLLVLQPRVEVEFAAQDIAERKIGAGVTKIEPGVRLRYEFRREFAPYLGIEYEAKAGKTAEIARAAEEDPDGLTLLVGVRAWF